jgi:hypothetical protein
MIQKVKLVLQNDVISIDLDDSIAPKTVKAILAILPASVTIYAWGEELYTDKIPVVVKPENTKSLVDMMDVAFWPPGNALASFLDQHQLEKKERSNPIRL